MIDPKVVEMQIYNTLPHLVVPVVTDPKKVLLALRWAIDEMEKRYAIFAQDRRAQHRQLQRAPAAEIAGRTRRRGRAAKAATPETCDCRRSRAEVETNRSTTMSDEELFKVDAPRPKVQVPRDDDLIIPDRMPYIVIIVDELADLMQTAPADVESAIARITQKARAAGIHMIIATQTPRADVITGVIKANVPCRIAFQVAIARSIRASSSMKTAPSVCSARATCSTARPAPRA